MAGFHTFAFFLITYAYTYTQTDFYKQIKFFLSRGGWGGGGGGEIPSIFKCCVLLRATGHPISWQHRLISLDKSRDGESFVFSAFEPVETFKVQALKKSIFCLATQVWRAFWSTKSTNVFFLPFEFSRLQLYMHDTLILGYRRQ